MLPNGVAPDVKLPDLPGWHLLSVRSQNTLINVSDASRSAVLSLSRSYEQLHEQGNFGEKSLKELVHWCYRFGIRGRFFEHPVAESYLSRIREGEENSQLGDGMA